MKILLGTDSLAGLKSKCFQQMIRIFEHPEIDLRVSHASMNHRLDVFR